LVILRLLLQILIFSIIEWAIINSYFTKYILQLIFCFVLKINNMNIIFIYRRHFAVIRRRVLLHVWRRWFRCDVTDGHLANVARLHECKDALTPWLDVASFWRTERVQNGILPSHNKRFDVVCSPHLFHAN